MKPSIRGEFYGTIFSLVGEFPTVLSTHVDNTHAIIRVGIDCAENTNKHS